MWIRPSLSFACTKNYHLYIYIYKYIEWSICSSCCLFVSLASVRNTEKSPAGSAPVLPSISESSCLPRPFHFLDQVLYDVSVWPIRCIDLSLSQRKRATGCSISIWSLGSWVYRIRVHLCLWITGFLWFRKHLSSLGKWLIHVIEDVEVMPHGQVLSAFASRWLSGLEAGGGWRKLAG